MSTPKQVRGQLRQIAKEILPEVLTEHVVIEVYKHIDKRLDAIESYIKQVLTSLEDRSKDTQSYLIRQASSQAEFLLKNTEGKK